jgi:hypothetical protein
MMKRAGFRMQAIADFVSACPGASQADAMRAAGIDPRAHGSYCANRPMGRAIQAGLVIIEHDGPQLTRLFANDRDRRRFHLRQELLTPGLPVDRIEELKAEIHQLDHERAQTWVQA